MRIIDGSKIRVAGLALGVAAIALAAAPLGWAGDDATKHEPAKHASATRVISFEGTDARFDVQHDAKAGTMTFRLPKDAKVSVTEAPTVTLRTDDGPRDVALVAVDGETNAWRLSDDVLKSDRFDGTVNVVVDGKTYSSDLGSDTVATEASFTERAPSAPAPAPADMPLDPAPTASEALPPAPPPAVNDGGCPKARAARHHPVAAPAAPLAPAPARAPVAALPSRGGEIVTFENGPRFEVVRDANANTYTFYQVDESIQGRPVVIDQPPTVFVGDRTYTLTRVENEPRAWRLAGFDAGASAPGDARMRISALGRSLETRVGLSGLGVSAR